MQCNIQEIAAPSPTNTTNFSVSMPSGAGFSINIRSNQVFFDCYWQGNVQPPITRNFAYVPMTSSVFSWDDEVARQNFIEFVLIPSGSYVLVEKF